MAIYIPMIILTVFLADIQERIRYRGRKISILLITLLPPTLVAAFRYNNGADYPMYFQLFTRLGNGSKIAGIEGKKLEVGFEYIVRLCQLVTRNQWFTFGAISFIISFLIFKECLNDSDDYRLSVLFYFVTGVYFDAYNGLRQYIAVSICFYAMKYILNKDAKRYFLAVLIAFLFHKSALFFVPVYFLQYLKFDFKKAITIVGLTVLSGSGLFAILKFVIKYTPYAFYFTLNSVELNEIVASQSSILFFGVSTIIGYYYYSKEKEIDTKTQLLYNMQIISLSIALMTAFVPLINRVLYYGMAYELLYLPNMLKLINNRREKMLVKVFLILMYGGITAYGMINGGWYTCIPYNFYFDYR